MRDALARRRARRAASLGGLLLLAMACPPAASPERSSSPPNARGVWFEEVGRSSGLRFEHRSGHATRYLFPEILGGGAALFDMDGDGDLDVYLVQSGTLEGPPGEEGRNRLFANRGDGRFEDVTQRSGADDPGYGMGVAVGDYDNDGDVDLYVTNLGSNVLLQNDGTGRFLDVSRAAAVDDASWSTSAAFLDYDADGDLDLFVVNYVDWSIGRERECVDPRGLAEYCLPTNYDAPSADRLYRNEGDGGFRDVTAEAGIGAARGTGLGVVCGDFDGDGLTDIFVANDAMLNHLWLNRAGRRFEEDALLRGCALDEQGLAKAGMGVAAEDVDDDGDQDLMVVNLENETDSFFRNDAGMFTDNTASAGLAGVSRRFTRFGAGWADFDNDGRLDLFQATGRVVRSPEPRTDDPYAEPNLLFRGDADGRFEEVLPRGGTDPPLLATARAAAFGDVDNDGGVDLVVVNRDGPVHLLRNVVEPRGRWIRFRVVDEHGREAYGARLSARVGDRRLTREVRAAWSYLASNDSRVHIGLGEAGGVERVEVRWPAGQQESFGDFEAGHDVTLRRGEGVAARQPAQIDPASLPPEPLSEYLISNVK